MSILITDEHVRQALALAVAMSVDGKEQKKYSDEVNRRLATGASARAIVKVLLLDMYDSLNNRR